MVGGFAVKCSLGRRFQSIAAGAVLQAPALSIKCWLCHIKGQLRLNADLFQNCIVDCSDGLRTIWWYHSCERDYHQNF